jgi:hypothetical protein
MSTKYIITGVIGFIVIIAWNLFLIERDNKLFKSYYMPNYEQVQ